MCFKTLSNVEKMLLHSVCQSDILAKMATNRQDIVARLLCAKMLFHSFLMRRNTEIIFVERKKITRRNNFCRELLLLRFTVRKGGIWIFPSVILLLIQLNLSCNNLILKLHRTLYLLLMCVTLACGNYVYFLDQHNLFSCICGSLNAA